MYGMVVIGFSAGGLVPMRSLLAALGAAYPLPVAAVAHLPAGDGQGFARLFTAVDALPIAFATDKQAILPGHAWLAPPDYHLLIESRDHFALSVDPPVNFVRPSIDVLFETAAAVFGDQLIALTLSSASSDGSNGMARVKAAKGLTIALAAANCEQSTLTDAVLEKAEIDYCVSLDEIITLLRSAH